MGRDPQSITPGQMTYHLRRLRLHGLIERVPRSHRYRVTQQGWRMILFCTRCHNRVLRPGLAQVLPEEAAPGTTLRRRFDQLDEATRDGLALSPHTIAELAKTEARRNRWATLAQWAIALLLLWIVILLLR